MLTTDQLIKQRIATIEKSGTNDWRTLYRQVNERMRVVKWNLAQQLSQLSTLDYSILYDEWGRGTGKTTHLTKKMKEMAETMPRGLGLFVVPTYAMFSTEIYSSLVSGFEANGWFEGLHYFVQREPPKNWNWEKPFKTPKTFERTIYTHTGFVFIIASQDANNAGVGTSVDVQLSDESALLSWQYMSTVIFPTVRGSGNRNIQDTFKSQSKYFGKHFFHSSTPMLPSGQELLYGLENGSFSDDLKKLGIGGVKIVRANWRFNKSNLAENYADMQKVLIPDKTTYNAQVENIRPPSVTGGYYTGLNKLHHTYTPLDTGHYQLVGMKADCRGDSDLQKGKPILLGLDWGDRINSLVACQLNGREIRALKAMYVLGDDSEMQDDLAEKFCTYYTYHDHKIVELYYDKTGNIKTGNTRLTRAQQFAQILRGKGWTVGLKTKGKGNANLEKRRQLWENILKEGKHPSGDDRHNWLFPVFRMNIVNCAVLWTSMANTPAKTGRDGDATKDKRSESRSSKVQPQHATHFGDAMDAIVWGLYARLLRSLGITIAESEL